MDKQILKLEIPLLLKVLLLLTKKFFRAEIHYDVGVYYRNTTLGDKAENVELALAAFQIALNGFTKEAFPTDWARTQNILGTTYLTRIKGDTAENQEKALAAYQNALEVYTKEAFPNDWARVQYNLGIAYAKRIKRDTAKNLELAIAAYQNASKVYTREAFPEEWAETQYHIGKLRVEQGGWYDGLAYLERSLAIYRQIDNLEARADTIYQIARTHHLMSNPEKARIHYRDALRLYQHLDNLPGTAACKTGLGRLMISIGFLDDALKELNQACQIYDTINNKPRVGEIQEILQLINKIGEKQLT